MFKILSQKKIEKNVKNILKKLSKKSDLDRTELAKEKTWFFTGSFVVNPFNWEKVPLWIWDYVLWNYWTWAVMAVPAHDERDFEFAKKYWLEINQSIARYRIYDWKKAPKKDVETLKRSTVDIIIENEKWEFLLQLEDEWSYSHCHFVWWWIEEWETELEAVKKEIIEETWFTDFEIIWPVDLSYKWGVLFRHTKNKNQDTIWRFFHIKLKSDNQIRSEIEDWKHRIEWCKKENIASRLNWDNHSDWWNLFLNWEKSFTEDWILTNSWEFSNLLTSKEARNKLSQFAEENNFWTKKTNFKLRDWVFSRQRYWWEPIPVVHCNDCGLVAEKEENLPLALPKVEKYEPSWTWESPLANIDEWVNCSCPKCWKPAKRETNTMPQWAWSSWYYLRFMDPQNSKSFVWKEVEKYWGQVDMYVWWAEHAVLHLLYARFWHKVLFDLWLVSHKEPFKELRNQWLIMAEWWVKMSKSLWNVVNPDDIISEFWADTLRLYEMFMWPFDQNIAWDTKWIKWVKRFLDKVWNLRNNVEENFEDSSEVLKNLHQTIKKVWEKIEKFEFNTAISDMMVFVNLLQKQEKIWRWVFYNFLKILNPFAPHLTEELNEVLWWWENLSQDSFPEYSEKWLVDNTINFAIQINWKVKAQFKTDINISKEDALNEAKKLVEKFLEWKEIRKEIFVPWKIIWFVV
jgi:leucyl-tRNA synthetase